MRAKLTLLRALVLGTVGGVLATGCQTYDFEPVEPLAISQTTETRSIEARARKPNLMLLVDTSGSMTDPVDESDPDCRPGGVLCGDSRPCNTAVCPTRWSELQRAMQTFLSDSGTIARIGLATYPNNDSCGLPENTATISIPLPDAAKDDDATLAANAELVKNKILSIKNYSTTEPTPQGGTPTSKSLQYVGTAVETDRDDFVVLLTDGLPNCNDKFPSTSECFCTLSDCTYAKEIGCLDTDASVSAVRALGTKEIKTIVIGFGADFNGTSESARRGAATLNGMAEAGGFPRACKVNADCGTGDTCETAKGLCSRRFYQASNSLELAAALREISEKVRVERPCELNFDEGQAPTKAELVVVYVNGERLSPGADTWSLTATGLLFTGSTCTRIESSTSANPVNIEVRAVKQQ